MRRLENDGILKCVSKEDELFVAINKRKMAFLGHVVWNEKY